MRRFIRFIVRSDHRDRHRCTGVVASLRILGEAGRLPDYYLAHSREIFGKLNAGLPCPPFEEKSWSPDCVSWFKVNDESRDWIALFREIVTILEDSDIETGVIITSRPGMIVYEDAYQVVAQSADY
ncbi:MAG: hypothetical protein Q7Q71_06090 [Verrucomicrobiota bacterium JB023]|nr:hypothetical protein [Verrucomicrobiota bacterium JB023]